MGVGKDLWTEVETLLNKGDWAGATSLYTNDGVITDPIGRYEGPNAIRAFVETMYKAFPDAKIETSCLVEEGGTVVAEYTFRATNTGPFPMPDGSEIPATGKTVEFPGVSVLTVRGGKFASEHIYFDSASMASQLGLMPST
jgi:steroid delta-isomerase-like uncharacterized protein